MLITVTLDPFGLQKWQNKKNDSTLPEKSIYTISRMICTLVCWLVEMCSNLFNGAYSMLQFFGRQVVAYNALGVWVG